MSGSAGSARAQLRHREVEQFRVSRGKSILLFITDRCPVGCHHCSVDSRPDSPRIRDFALFKEIVEWIADQPELEVVGISGGEPFVERNGLSIACRRFASAGKRIVVFTSGVWAGQRRTPLWIEDVLKMCACVYLSTDAFHAEQISEDAFIRAAQAVSGAGSWLVVQGLNDAATAKRIEQLMPEAFGADWRQVSEVVAIAPLANGRGASVFALTGDTQGANFGPCTLVRNPMVRYDGAVSACCNESVIMGFGPTRLRRRAASAKDLREAVATFGNDPLLQVIGQTGFGALTRHPRLVDLAEQRFATNCNLCWKSLARLSEGSEPDRLVAAMAALQAEPIR